MNPQDIRIGSKVAIKHKDKLGMSMTVTGVFSTLSDLSHATLYLDFEENEGDVWEVEAEEVELVKE